MAKAANTTEQKEGASKEREAIEAAKQSLQALISAGLPVTNEQLHATLKILTDV